MGNICRSPAAEGAFRREVAARAAGGRVSVDSAGTHGYHVGEPSDERMRRAAAQRGLSLDGRARRVERGDFDLFDWIVAMDRDNLAALERLRDGGSRARLHLLSDFLPAGSPVDVPDPYYGGDAGFETVLDLVQRAAPELLERVLGEREEAG